MNLLDEPAAEGYPEEYLLARIKGKRVHRINNWQQRIDRGRHESSTEEKLWSDLLREMNWLYRQMNLRLRAGLNPVFTLFELRTLVLCLRNKSPRFGHRVGGLLKHSLLSAELKKLLYQGDDQAATVGAIAIWLANRSKGSPNLAAAYAQGGLKRAEEELTRGYLEQLPRRQPPLVALLLAHYIDLRNLLALYKKIHWQLEAPCRFVEGGSLRLDLLGKAAAQGDPAAFEDLLPRLGLFEGQVSPQALEATMMKKLSRAMRRIGRATEGPGPILEHLWRQFVETRNLRLISLCRGVDRSTLANELIQ